MDKLFHRFLFTPYPNGIYAVEFSKNLKKGTVNLVTFMGQKIALFRTMTGEVGAINAYCPHLGADLSKGKVINK